MLEELKEKYRGLGRILAETSDGCPLKEEDKKKFLKDKIEFEEQEGKEAMEEVIDGFNERRKEIQKK